MIKKKNLVIIGSRSFIGKNIVENYNKEYNLILINSKTVNLEKKININKIKKIIPKKSIIIFLAFKTKHEILSDRNLIENFEIISKFADIISIVKPLKIVFFSSISVYGDNNNYKNFTEKSKVKPDNDYGKAKAISEILLEQISKNLNFKLLILRIPRVFGKYDYKNNYGPTKFLNDLSQKKNIKIWGDGKEHKHFLYVKDLLYNLNNLLRKNKFGTYNLCPTKSHSFVSIAKLVLKSFRSNLKIIFNKRNGMKSNHIIDNSKIQKVEGTKFTNMKSALKEYYLLFK